MLSISTSFVLRKDEGKMLVMNIENGDIFEANKVCEVILSLCDGKHSEKDIIKEICGLFPDQKDTVIKKDVSDCIANLKENGIVK